MFRKWIVAIFLGCVFAGSAEAESQFGRYIGVLKHAQIPQDQLAKLDFVVSRQSPAEFRLIAVLTLYFGDCDSREYVTYHFNSVAYNVLTGSLVFDQPDQEITLVVSNFANGRFEGRVRSVSAGDVGTLELTQEKAVTPARPLVQQLWGEYRGVCDGVTTVLQVQTQRASGEQNLLGNVFGNFAVTAQLAEVDPAACFEGSNLCVMRTFESSSYNFFKGRLDLLGQSRSLSCQVDGAGLNCDQCKLKRASNELATVAAKAFPMQSGGFSGVPAPGGDVPAAAEPAAPLSGTYYGYLFHERLGVYQAVALNVVTYQATGAGGHPALFVSATSSMYFGGFQSQESVSQRFKEREFPLLSPQIVLERLEEGADTVVQLTQLGNGKARGIWYSILFGRVGTFELSNTSQPTAPTGATVMDSISGKYTENNWTLNLSVVRETSTVNSVNPFFPLNFKGTARLEDITPNIRIRGGAYDFYTGKLGFQLEDDSLFTGFRTDNKHLALKRPTHGILRHLSPHQVQSFAKVTP